MTSKMHSECTILMQISQKEIPRTPACGREWPPPPFGATRISEAFGFISHLCPRAVAVLDPSLFYEFNCRCILNYWNDYGMFIFYNGSLLEIHQCLSSKQTNMTTKQDNYSQRAWYFYLLDHTKIVSRRSKIREICAFKLQNSKLNE